MTIAAGHKPGPNPADGWEALFFECPITVGDVEDFFLTPPPLTFQPAENEPGMVPPGWYWVVPDFDRLTFRLIDAGGEPSFQGMSRELMIELRRQYARGRPWSNAAKRPME